MFDTTQESISESRQNGWSCYSGTVTISSAHFKAVRTYPPKETLSDYLQIDCN